MQFMLEARKIIATITPELITSRLMFHNGEVLYILSQVKATLLLTVIIYYQVPIHAEDIM